jgi:hypothetical protein
MTWISRLSGTALIKTCKLNAIDPFAYLTSTFTALSNGHGQRNIDE